METLFESVNRIGPVIAEYVNKEEGDRRLCEPVIQALREAGMHKLFMPKSLGGLESDPLTVAKLVEEVAHYNTAAGWSVMVANISTWFCSRLPEKAIEEIYRNGSNTLIAGSLHPPMMATREDGGFRINGRTPLTSNVHEARWIVASALVMEGGQLKINNGIPEVIAVSMDREHCEIIDTWFTLGMKATDSNDVAANNVFVPDHLSFPLVPEFEPNQYYRTPLYRFSAIGASAASLIAPVALAVARNAINEFKALAQKKTSMGSVATLRERGGIQRKLGIAEALVQSSRAYLHQTLAQKWEKTITGNKLSLEDKAELLLAATHTNQSCVQAVDLMYSAAGSSAIYKTSKLSRCFSDAQVIRQHGFANDSRYETAAQTYFGLQPDFPLLAF
jgi:alkylation response protein AidB-like acyl-CoA dehydrogenase